MRMPFPVGWSERPSPNMARRRLSRGRDPGEFRTRKSRRPGGALGRDRPVETVVQAVPDRVAVLVSAGSPMRRHDFYFLAILHARCSGIWGVLSPTASNASDPTTRHRKLGLLRLRSTR